MKTILCFIILTVSLIPNVFGLDCYVCLDQDGNNEKCIKTVAPCEAEQDYCMSIVRWGSTPYWTLGAKKQYYLSKRCSTKETCKSVKKDFMRRCERTGYNDWECAECCQGDRCNYYVTLAGNSIRYNCLLITIGFSLVIFVLRLH